MKIVNLALQKNGTKSFHHFCRNKGLSSIHWLPVDSHGNYCRDYLKILESAASEDLARGGFETVQAFYERYYLDYYDCFSDTPIPVLRKMFLERYPNATYLLVYRDPDRWVDSVQRHFQKICTKTDILVYKYLTGVEVDHILDYTARQLKQAYEFYIQETIELARTHHAHLHLLSLDRDDQTDLLNRIIPYGQSSRFGRYR